MTVLAITVASYAVAELIHASGFAAVYLAAIVLGNARLPHRAAVRGFAEGLSWIAQMGLFVMLGLLASPSRLPSAIVPGLLIGLGLLLLSRPISVLVSTLPFRVPPREMAFLSWAGLRGAVPIVLATVPVAAGVPGSDQVLDIVFVIVVAFTLIQAPTLQFMARKLRIGEAVGAVDLDVEVSPLGSFGADIVQVSVGTGSQLHGVEVFELRLPPGAVVSLDRAQQRRPWCPTPQHPHRARRRAAAGGARRAARACRTTARGGLAQRTAGGLARRRHRLRCGRA